MDDVARMLGVVDRATADNGTSARAGAEFR
jgi:hypothetical protein